MCMGMKYVPTKYMTFYFATEQELSLSSPLVSPTENEMMKRISSSIIRELSSNMLIPYTRLKLMECVGQGMLCIQTGLVSNYLNLFSYTITGEFGVVYKAQYTEPEGDIGYKTSTVAVKTLKGTLICKDTCMCYNIVLSKHRFL